MLFRIRGEQVAVFTRHLEDQFAERMASHLRSTFPREVERLGVDETGLKALARQGLVEARAWGVVNEPDVRRYVECLAILGPEFVEDGKYTWAAGILARDDLDGEAKMDRIDEYLIHDLRVGC